MLTELYTVLSKLREFRRNEQLSRSELQLLKIKKIRHLVKHASQHSSYYADIIKERSINIEKCVPGDFPVLTKSILMSNYDRIVTDHRITKCVFRLMSPPNSAAIRHPIPEEVAT